jgi:alpha-L-arabinofuranosidase
MNKKAVTGAEGQNGLFASAVFDKNEQAIIVKVANTSDRPQALSVKFDGLKKKAVLADGRCITLHADDIDSENTLDKPTTIVPREAPLPATGNVLSTELGAKTFAVYIYKVK